MPSPAKIEIHFVGRDPLIGEGISEIYHVASVSGIPEGISIGVTYAEWRRTWVAKGLAICGVSVSLIQKPVISNLTTTFLSGNADLQGSTNRRDLMSCGYYYLCRSADWLYKSKRCYRCFPDTVITYADDGSELISGAMNGFRDDLVSKTTSLGLGMKSISKDPAISLPKPIASLVVVAGVMTGVVATGTDVAPGYEEGERITITGCKGTNAGRINGVYRIVGKNASTLSLLPQLTIPQGFVYVGGSGQVQLRIPSYPVIGGAEFVRFSSRETGAAPFTRRGKSKAKAR